MLIFYLSFIMIFLGILSFSLNRKHTLLMLMSLEFTIISMFFMFLNFLVSLNNEIYISMIFLTMSVCEGVLGLSILIMIIRTHGNDYFKSFNFLW
uniref:NADH-ubiquinone oxidoreductase chain 4L n=1 Tax=Curculionoidea sp. 10 KM-2017 TaxID=2219393 RepID=A0A346RIA0_9CUCU|nr:NADH dehydrogenase subunit 4L [Curculionoidea sp. 10 KM-2017]